VRHICAWCKCETAPPDGTADDDLISHGICEECKKIVIAGIKDIRKTEGAYKND
jgi:hypothetical protein